MGDKMAFGLTKEKGYGGQYVYYERLKSTHIPEYINLYYRAKQGFSWETNYSNTSLRSIGEYFHSLASGELEKEKKLLSTIFGKDFGNLSYANFGGNTDQEGQKFAKELIESINIALGLEKVFRRNLSIILKSKGKKGVFSHFDTYFKQVWEGKGGKGGIAEEIANELKEAIRHNPSTDLAVLAKELLDKKMPDIVKEAIRRMLSAKTEIAKDNSEYQNAYERVLQALDDVNFKSQTNELINFFIKTYQLDQLSDFMVKNYENQEAYKNIENKEKGNFNISTNVAQRAGLTLEMIENYITNLVAQGIGSGGTGDIKYSMESVHTGGKNVKPDNIILINANASIAKKWMEEEKFGGRQENVLAIKNLQQRLSGINDGFIIYTTAKNYTLNKRFQEVLNGYPAGKMTSLQNFNAAAWNIEINTDALITTVMQLIPGAVGEGNDDAVKTALSRAIAAALFDDFNTIGQEVNIGGSLTSIHLFDLQGVLMPFSYYLQLLGDAFTSVGGFGDINDERIRQLISVDIEVPPSIMFPTQAQQNLYYIATGNNPWNAQAKDALNNSRIGFHFLAGLRSILEGLFN